MRITNTWPGTWGEKYDALRLVAQQDGVCSKIVNGNHDSTMKACGRPLMKGSQWCAVHQLWAA